MKSSAIAISLLTCLLAGSAWANTKLETRGAGKSLELDVSSFPVEQQKLYGTFKQKCSKCHALARPISALQSGKTPISGSAFDDQGIKKYVVKMMRKPNSGILKAEAKELISFLRFARAKAQGK